jgi:hypothetical protein
LEGKLFLLPGDLINDYIQRDINPAILCLWLINHFPKKFGMESAMMGLCWHWGLFPFSGFFPFFSPGLKMVRD